MQLYDTSTLSLSRCLNASRCTFHVTEYYNTTVAATAIIYKAGSICLARPGDDDIEILEDDSGLRTAPSWELPGFNRIRIVYTTLLVMFTNLFPHKFLWYIYIYISIRFTKVLCMNTTNSIPSTPAHLFFYGSYHTTSLQCNLLWIDGFESDDGNTWHATRCRPPTSIFYHKVLINATVPERIQHDDNLAGNGTRQLWYQTTS